MRAAFVPAFLGCSVLTFVAAGSARARPAVDTLEQAIVGGDALASEEVTATALIGTCDATLVAPRLLLTAAHCLSDTPTHAWFGSSRAEAALEVPIERCVAHPDYRKELGADLGFCELRADVSSVEPALVIGECEPADESIRGAPLWLVGHGYARGPDDTNSERVARAVEVQVNALVSQGRELVVGDEAHGACHGDSGGSVFGLSAEGAPRLVGVISRRGPAAAGGQGEDCASTTLVTALRPHIAWLAAAAKLASTRCPTGGDTPDATESAGCSVRRPASNPHMAATVLMLACAVLLRVRRRGVASQRALPRAHRPRGG